MTSAPASTITSWRLNPAVEFDWRDWGGDAVVFEVRSGQTLVFDPLTAAVVALIEAGAEDIGTVTQTLAADLGVSPDAGLTETLWTVLERLHKLGWIEPRERSPA